MEVALNPAGPVYGGPKNVPQDWSGYDALMLDVFNPNDVPVPADVMVFDKAWQAKISYWNRYNATAVFGPGKTIWSIPVRGMYRGEAGSRNNDIQRNVDPDGIVRVAFGFGREGLSGRLLVDNFRLVKAEAPKGVRAFDFGPASQAVMLGWTPVSNLTTYDAKKGYGWKAAVFDTYARDTTFGPALTRDFVECGGNTFRVDVPEGKYTVTLFFENCGYWDGEQARQHTRRIEADGKTVWSEEKPDGPAHTLWRFENVEPIGVDIWDTYMAPEIAKPCVFEAAAGKDGLSLTFNSDAPWGSRIAGMAVCRADDGEGAKWLKGQLDSLATEFRGMVVRLDKPADAFEPGADWRKLGLVAWPAVIEDKISPNSTPPANAAAPGRLQISRLAVLGEYEPFCIAIRPLKDLGECKLRLEGGSPGVEAEIGVVWYGMNRGLGSIAYTVVPHTLRPQATVPLPKDVTRQIVVTCKVSEQAPAGDAKLALVVEGPDGRELLRVPLTLSVHAVKLNRDADYCMGMFGMTPPAGVPKERVPAVMEETFRLLREHGMNAVCGAANFHLKSFKDGRPVIDFAEMDAFVEQARRYGFTRGINAYGGAHLTGINDGYEIGATGKRIAEESGLPYKQALMKAWAAVDEHARKAGWPKIFYVICDETRVRERAERELEFMKAMSAVTEAFPQTVRTSGAYSVSFTKRPEDLNDLLYWHQRFFEALDISSLGLHDESVMAEAANLGKEIHIYNQGTSRYSFGLYQWSEYRKGVTARWQWHLNNLHGYQFFDLDGREPDAMMVCYGRTKLYPTISFERVRQGAQDFYLYNALWNLVQKGAGTGDARAKAKALLEDPVSKMTIFQRKAPDGFDADAFKAQVVAAMESLK
jgi:hypothetical protein